MKKASKEKLIKCLRKSVKTWNRYRRFTKYKAVDLQDSDLQDSDMRYADLRYADLRGADLRYANLRGADLYSANLDYTSISFHCGSIGIKCDERLIQQSLYHVARYEYVGNDKDIEELLSSDLYKKVANKFHRVDECGAIK